VADDPFYTINDLKVVLEEALPGHKTSWWSVFKILRKLKLLSRRSRFRFARHQSRRA
jgi:hypothetical protein